MDICCKNCRYCSKIPTTVGKDSLGRRKVYGSCNLKGYEMLIEWDRRDSMVCGTWEPLNLGYNETLFDLTELKKEDEE